MLCDAVGMGKTCSALTVFIKDIQETASPRKTLVLCPGGIQSLVWKVSFVFRRT
jgi:SNF2 family DNA or RNA helicase